MKAKNIMDALNDVDYDMVEQALEEPKKGKQPWLKWGAAAACAVVAISVGAFALFGQNSPVKTPEPPLVTSNGRSSTGNRRLIPVHEGAAIEWPWEYKTAIEKYPVVTLNGAAYGTRAREIGETLLGETLGACAATGYDIYTEISYPAEFDVRAILGVDPAQLVAVDLEGTWVVFLREGLPIPATLGDWMDALSLSENISLTQFRNAAGEYYLADSDTTFWQTLSECRDATGRINGIDNPEAGNCVTFTVTSEALGVYKKTLTVTEDGRLFTNLMEYGYVYEIGADAAGQIIRSVTEHCRETEAEPYYPMLAGKLIEIGDGYILVDDSSLCENEADGLVYKVLTDDLRARRCLLFPAGNIDLGAFVVVEYSGTIDTSHKNTVSGAFSISKAIFTENGAQVPENAAEAAEGTVVTVTRSDE